MEPQLFDLVYASVVKREPTYEGIYYTGVKTTRIVCRPTCRARTPRPENVIFFPSLEKALQAGFRPCKRCRPDANGALRPDAALAAQADAVMEARYMEKLTLGKLSASLAVSPYHLQRTYKQVRGCSPAEKLEGIRLQQARRMLAATGAPVAEIGCAVGYASPSHFSAWFSRRTGISPAAYRNEQASRGGRPMSNMLFRHTVMGLNGPWTVVASEKGIRTVLYPPQFVTLARQEQEYAEAAKLEENRHLFEAFGIMDLLEQYFSGHAVSFSRVPLDLDGTPFQRQVWESLSRIPYGETRTYKQLAEYLGKPSAARAVGAAVGRNPAPIVLPCHRVVGSNGTLTGFRGGLQMKQAILTLEGITHMEAAGHERFQF